MRCIYISIVRRNTIQVALSLSSRLLVRVSRRRAFRRRLSSSSLLVVSRRHEVFLFVLVVSCRSPCQFPLFPKFPKVHDPSRPTIIVREKWTLHNQPNLPIAELCKLATPDPLSSRQRVSEFVRSQHYDVYDTITGLQLCQNVTLPHGVLPDAYWAHEDTLQFAASFNTGGRSMVDIYELQPTLIPPHQVVSSFPVPVMGGDSPSPQPPSMPPLLMKWSLSYLMFRTQISCCGLKCLIHAATYKGNSLLMDASLHVEHWSVGFVFGRIHPLVIYPGVVSNLDYHFWGSYGHPLQSQLCVGVWGEFNC